MFIVARSGRARQEVQERQGDKIGQASNTTQNIRRGKNTQTRKNRSVCRRVLHCYTQLSMFFLPPSARRSHATFKPQTIKPHHGHNGLCKRCLRKRKGTQGECFAPSQISLIEISYWIGSPP